MSQILVMSIFNYPGLAWIHYSESFWTVVLLIIWQLSALSDLTIEYYLFKETKLTKIKNYLINTIESLSF